MTDWKTYESFVAEAVCRVREVFPWDLEEMIAREPDLLLLDIRERLEFQGAHIKGSLNVPRGILEPACEYGYYETVPELVEARKRPIVAICRSGRRSVLAAATLQQMGYENVLSLKLGIRGWNDSEYPLVDGKGNDLTPDEAEARISPAISPEQLGRDLGDA